MSTTSQQATRQRTVTAADAFETLIFNNPDVCSHCFRRLGDSEHANLQRPLGTLYYNFFYAGHDGGFEDFPDMHDWEGGLRTVCQECGRRRATDAELLSRAEMVAYAENIVDRLAEYGLDADLDVLRDFIDTVKRQSDAQGYETEMFARGTKLAIRHSR